MHNQTGITHRSYSYNDWQAADTDLIFSRFVKKHVSQKRLERLKNLTGAVLAALAAGVLLTGGICFFLIQLANHGW